MTTNDKPASVPDSGRAAGEMATPRNDALTNEMAGASDAEHLIALDVLSRTLETELAAAIGRNLALDSKRGDRLNKATDALRNRMGDISELRSELAAATARAETAERERDEATACCERLILELCAVSQQAFDVGQERDQLRDKLAAASPLIRT